MFPLVEGLLRAVLVASPALALAPVLVLKVVTDDMVRAGRAGTVGVVEAVWGAHLVCAAVLLLLGVSLVSILPTGESVTRPRGNEQMVWFLFVAPPI